MMVFKLLEIATKSPNTSYTTHCIDSVEFGGKYIFIINSDINFTEIFIILIFLMPNPSKYGDLSSSK